MTNRPKVAHHLQPERFLRAVAVPSDRHRPRRFNGRVAGGELASSSAAAAAVGVPCARAGAARRAARDTVPAAREPNAACAASAVAARGTDEVTRRASGRLVVLGVHVRHEQRARPSSSFTASWSGSSLYHQPPRTPRLRLRLPLRKPHQRRPNGLELLFDHEGLQARPPPENCAKNA
jgi:hypothetical protein